MRGFDHDYVADVVARFGKITSEVDSTGTPRSGIIAHLVAAIRYSSNKSPRTDFRGNWFTSRVLAPLTLNGIVGFSGRLGVPELCTVRSGKTDDLESLHAELEDYLFRVQSGELIPPPHPVFGEIGIDGWADFHVLHFDYHLRRFGV